MDKRIAIYLRVSTLDQSCEVQRREIEQYLSLNGWSAHKAYEDKATGTNRNRDAFKSLLLAVENKEVDTVIVWKLDRLCRSLKDLVNTLHSFTDNKVDFISIKDQIDMTTPSGRLMTHLLAAFAEFEASMIRERVRAGLANAKAKGKKLGRPNQINPVTAYELRKKNMSLSEIARHMGCTKSAVSKVLKKIEENKPLKNIENTKVGKDV